MPGGINTNLLMNLLANQDPETNPLATLGGNPLFQIGLGLAGAGGPSPVPLSFGQRLAQGVGGGLQATQQFERQAALNQLAGAQAGAIRSRQTILEDERNKQKEFAKLIMAGVPTVEAARQAGMTELVGQFELQQQQQQARQQLEVSKQAAAEETREDTQAFQAAQQAERLRVQQEEGLANRRAFGQRREEAKTSQLFRDIDAQVAAGTLTEAQGQQLKQNSLVARTTRQGIAIETDEQGRIRSVSTGGVRRQAPTANRQDQLRGELDAANDTLAMFDRFVGVLEQNPALLGSMGIVGTAVEDVGGSLSDLVKLTGGTFDVSRIEDMLAVDVQQGRVEPDVAKKSFAESLGETEYFINALGYRLARIRKPDAKISNDDVKRTVAEIDPRSFGRAEKAMTRIRSIRDEIKQGRDSLAGRLGEQPEAAPSQIPVFRFDASGQLVPSQ